MSTLSISEAAQRTGFTPSALRFYEQAGLVEPARTASGYRSYGEEHLESLRFIRRGKGLGLSLDEITELLGLIDDARCGPVQGRLSSLIDDRIDAARAQIEELVAFTAELAQVRSTLGVHTPDGPCDETCGCRTDRPTATPEPVTLTVKDRLAAADGVPIACSLPSAEVDDRLDAWAAVMAQAASVRRTDTGVSVTFFATIDVGEVANLAAAERRCCSFFAFTIAIGQDAVVLDVSAPDDAHDLVDLLIGSAA